MARFTQKQIQEHLASLSAEERATILVKAARMLPMTAPGARTPAAKPGAKPTAGELKRYLESPTREAKAALLGRVVPGAQVRR